MTVLSSFDDLLVIGILMIITQTQLRIMQLLVGNINKLFSIRQVARILNTIFEQVHKNIRHFLNSLYTLFSLSL